MMYEEQISETGAVTIPAALRERLGLKPGDTVRFVEEADGAVTVQPTESPLLEGFKAAQGKRRDVDAAQERAEFEAMIAEDALTRGQG